MEIAAADGGKIYAHGSGILRVTTTVNGLGRQADLEGMCYAPGIRARLVSIGRLTKQGWDVRISNDAMELWDQNGDLFVNVEMTNHVYPIRLNVIPPKAALAAWITGDDNTKPTHGELVWLKSSTATYSYNFPPVDWTCTGPAISICTLPRYSSVHSRPSLCGK